MEVQCADGNKSPAHSGDDGQMVRPLIEMSLVMCVCVWVWVLCTAEGRASRLHVHVWGVVTCTCRVLMRSLKPYM